MAEKVGLGFVGDYVQYANSTVAENPDDLTPAEWHAQAEFFERAFDINFASAIAIGTAQTLNSRAFAEWQTTTTDAESV